MKKITTFLGCVGVVCLILGCSSESDDLEKIVTPNQTTAEVASSSETKTPGSSAANITSSNSGSANSPASSGNTTPEAQHDTVHKEVVINSSPSEYSDPYFSSGIFCWTPECEEEWAGKSSSSTAKSSSSTTIDIGMSAPVLPTVTETDMIDQRDQNVYKLIRIGGVHWMNENLKYKPEKGIYCDNNGTDVCEEYGVFYTYSVAQSICPGGWRLPTQEEVEAASSTVDFEWWTIGGRFEVSSDGSSKYDQAGKQGRLWLTPSSSVNSVRIENYDNKTFNFEAASTTERAYNVRCVEGE